MTAALQGQPVVQFTPPGQEIIAHPRDTGIAQLGQNSPSAAPHEYTSL